MNRYSSFRFDGEQDLSEGEDEQSPKNFDSQQFASFRVVHRNRDVNKVEDDEVECHTPGAPFSPPRGPKGRAGPSAFAGHILEGTSRGGHVEDMQTCSMGEPGVVVTSSEEQIAMEVESLLSRVSEKRELSALFRQMLGKKCIEIDLCHKREKVLLEKHRAAIHQKDEEVAQKTRRISALAGKLSK